MEFKFSMGQEVWFLSGDFAKTDTIIERTWREADDTLSVEYGLIEGGEILETELYETPEALIRGIFEGSDMKEHIDKVSSNLQKLLRPTGGEPIGTGDFVAEFQTPKSYSPPKYGPVTAYSKFDDGAWYSIQCNVGYSPDRSKPCAGCGKEIYGVSHITGIDLFCEDCWSKGTSE